MNTHNEILNAAISYVQNGLHIFPLMPCDKRPLTKNGFKDASDNIEDIYKWWGQYPDANIGLPTGELNNLVVVDIDGVYPPEWPPLQPTHVVKTAKGHHYYYAYPEGFDIRSRTKIDGYDIDVRANGGYVVAPPSYHPNGGRYEFIALSLIHI